MLPRATHKGTRSDLSVLTRTLRKTWNRLIPNGMTDNLSLPDGTNTVPPLPVLFLCLVSNVQESLCLLLCSVVVTLRFFVSECKGNAFIRTTKTFPRKISRLGDIFLLVLIYVKFLSSTTLIIYEAGSIN